MSKKIIYTQTNGVAAIINPNEFLTISEVVRSSVPVEALEDYVLVAGVGQAVSGKKGDQLNRHIAQINNVAFTDVEYEIVDSVEIPEDRSFRESWIHDTTNNPQKVSLDVEKAKEISLTRVREARKEKFAALDVESTMVMEQGGDVAPIVARKEALRAATDPIKAFTRSGSTMAVSSGNELIKLEALPE